MFNVSNKSLPISSTVPESDHDSCDKLHLFFKDANKEIISVSDATFCALNMLSCIFAVCTNLLILFALYKATSLHPPSKALLSSLALSDLGVGAIVQPLFVAYRWTQIHGDLTNACIAGIISHIEGSHFSAVSFLTMTAISVDRLLAMVLRIRYHRVVTFKRVLVVLLAIWILSGVWASFWVTNQRDYSVISIILIPICFLITLFSYTKIYFCLRRQTIQIENHSQPSTSMDTSNRSKNISSQIRYRRSVISMFYLFCALLLSFLPYLSHKILVRSLGWRSSMSVLFSCGLTLVYINSSVNPLIYCWRISEVKEIVMRILCDAKNFVWGKTLMPTGTRVVNLR